MQNAVEEHLDSLYNDDLNLSSLESHEDQEIIYMTQIIDDQKAKLVAFKPEINLEDISIALQLRESSYEKIQGLLSSTCSLMLDYLRFDDNTPIKFDHILEKEKFWLCVSCNRKLSNDEILCNSCHIFRPLEMFKNLVHSPMKVTEEEQLQLEKRRKMEKSLIFEKDNNNSESEMWMIISTNWLLQWKCFLSNKTTAKIEGDELDFKHYLSISENPSIGVLPPGPISNCDLLSNPNDNESPVKPDLMVNRDYRGVSKDVW